MTDNTNNGGKVISTTDNTFDKVRSLVSEIISDTNESETKDKRVGLNEAEQEDGSENANR